MQIARSLVSLAIALAVAGCGSQAPVGSASTPSGGSPAVAASPDSAATPGASDPTAGGPTAAGLEQLLVQAVGTPIDASDPGPTLDRTEQGMKDYLRQSAGIADLLGPGGAATLAGIDAAERQLVAAMVTGLRAQAAAPGAGTPVPDVAWSPNGSGSAQLAGMASPARGGSGVDAQGGESLFGAFMFTMMAPDLYAKAPRDASGKLDRETMTEEKTLEDGSAIRLTLQPSLAGSRLSADVKVEITVPGPPAYKEEATGTLVVDLCPDASGVVPLTLSLGGGYSLNGGGMQYKVSVTATGHTDDSGKLASMDVATDGSLASQPQKGQEDPGKAPMYIELRTGFSVSLGSDQVSNASGSAPRYSSRVDEAFVKMAIGMTSGMGSIATVLGFQSAERMWTTGYCLEITVPEMDAGGSKRVATSSTTPFTAKVRHKFEGTDLAVPVTATLGSGGVSVSPSGSKVPAPATFSYKAPDKDRQTATVNLETRSKRGVATLAATFLTSSPGWIYRGMDGAIAGRKCDGPGGDWVEEMVVKSLGMTSKWVMTVDGSTLKGTYTMDSTQKLKGGSGTWHGTGRASVTLGPDGTAEISLSGGRTTIKVRTSGGSSTQTVPGPEGQHSVWMPAGDECR